MRKIEAFAMPQGDLAFGIEGHAVRLIVGSGPKQEAHFVGLTRAEALAARDALDGALRAFAVGEEIVGAPV